MDYPFHVRDIHISDPFILADEATHKYYIYAAVFNRDRYPELFQKGRVYALVSEDLVHWSDPILVFEKKDFWADEDYWAPECHIWKGRYYLISSFRAAGRYRKCQCLVADSPLGPFKPVQQEALTPPDLQSQRFYSVLRMRLGVTALFLRKRAEAVLLPMDHFYIACRMIPY